MTKNPRLAARIAGKFILRVIGLFAIVIAAVATAVAVEFWIASMPGVSQDVAHPIQISFFVIAVALVLWGAWLFGGVIARPLATVIAWTRNLARGDLEPPREPDGRIKGQDADGHWRGGYKTFHEVFEALQALTDELAETERQRAEIRRIREEWIAGVSHDLKTPLASVRGYAQLLATDEEPPEEVHRQAGAILEQAQNMERLLDDLRLTTRLAAGALPLQSERVDAVDLARSAALSVLSSPGSDAYEFELTAREEPIWICADANQLGRAFRNLMTNAVFHNPVGTKVDVTVERSGGTVAISVADNGTGMDEETVERLFDRYYRGTSTTVDVASTGLGMAIARQLVEAHEGSVKVESELGVGTTVTVLLPLAPDRDAPEYEV